MVKFMMGMKLVKLCAKSGKLIHAESLSSDFVENLIEKTMNFMVSI